MSENRRYFWMKFKQDFFRSLRIRKLRSLAGGDTFTIIYLKMQLLSISTEGYLSYKGIYDSFADEVAEEIDEDVENVKVTIEFLTRANLLVPVDTNEYFLPYAAENIGSETASTIRSRDCRIRQKEAELLQCNTNATNCNTDIDIETNIKKELEIKLEEEEKDILLIPNLFKEICKSYPNKLLDKTGDDKRIKTILEKSIQTYSLDDFRKVFEKVEQSQFLKGQNKNKWVAPFTWIINPTNMQKILDGVYDDSNNGYVRQGDIYDMDKLEKMLLGED